MVNIAIFASGAGTNARQIIQYFRNSPEAKIALIVISNQEAGAIAVAEDENIPFKVISKSKFRADGYLLELKQNDIDFVVLAGFLWKIPPILVDAYPDRIVNIHPALLPKYGGKGMYGKAVHQAVVAAGDKESGITVHLVDNYYDHGKIIFQATCQIDGHETPETLAQKIHVLEHTHFARVIEGLLKSKA